MKKRTGITVIITLLLASVAVYFFNTRKQGTIREELKDFAVKDTAAITRIFLADKENKSVTLEKNALGEWILNGRYEAREDAIHTLLETIHSLEVKAPVGHAALDNVVKAMAARSTKVEIYQDGKNVKTYYVGHEAPDKLGTFMILENSSRPFVMHIPGFDGFLSVRYFTSEKEWRERNIFNHEPRSIASVRIEHPRTPQHSFEVSHDVINNTFTLKALASGRIIPADSLDMEFIQQYFFHFRKVNFETIVNDINRNVKDSILQSTPLSIITVTDLDGKKTGMRAFLKAYTEERRDENGEVIPYDVDRLFAEINGGKDFVVIQYYVFDKILLPLGEFLKKEDAAS